MSALTLESMRADIAQVLDVPPAEIGDDDDLLDHGLDSVRAMMLTERWRAAGARVELSALAECLQLGAWWRLVEQAQDRDRG